MRAELYQGDCLEVMGQVPSKSIDMIICDLPYGVTQNQWDVKIPLDRLWAAYRRVAKPAAAIVLFSQMPFTAELVMSNRKMFRYEWIWQKTLPKGHLNAKKMPMKAHENILVFYDRLPTYNPQMTHGHTRKVTKSHYIREADGTGCYGREVRDTHYDSTDRYPLDVQTFSNGDQTKKCIRRRSRRSCWHTLSGLTRTEGLWCSTTAWGAVRQASPVR